MRRNQYRKNPETIRINPNKAYKEDIIRRYDERLAKYGYDPRTLGWLKGRQTVRFAVLTEIGEMRDAHVLDVGCGFGDLFGFLQKAGLSVRYTGCDINPRLIEIAKERYSNAKFLTADITDLRSKHAFDWVVASGVFEFKYPKMYDLVRRALLKMFTLAKLGVAADFMSSYVGYRGKDAFHASPELIFRIAKSLSKRVMLRHDYMPYEFCIYIYKKITINERNVFSAFDDKLVEKFGTNELFPVVNSDRL